MSRATRQAKSPDGFEKSVLLSLDEKHIAKGQRQKPNSCPITLRFREVFARASEIHVSREWVFMMLGESPYLYTIPAEAVEWQKRFDDGLPVAPISFEVLRSS